MAYLIFGLVIFLGAHSLRIYGDAWRARALESLGQSNWKLIISALSVAGFLIMVWGYGLARQTPVQIWAAPTAMRHLASLLTLPAFVLLAAAYVPGNGIKSRLRHPMVLSVKLWALAHLLANGNLNQMVLFGSFLVWSVLSFRAARARDRRESPPAMPARRDATVMSVLLGVSLWLAFTLWLHGLLIGVRPLG